MILLDAYAVIALLRDEPAASDVQRILEGREAVAIPVLGVAEVLDYLIRLTGAEEDEAALDLAQLQISAAPPLDVDVAARAGLLRAQHYHRRDRALSLADCVLIETARALNATVATADRPLLETCTAEGIATMPLPDARGVTWRR